MRPFQKKNSLGKFLVNFLILGAALFFLSGPAKELAIWLAKSFSSFNQTISENSGMQIDKLINLAELIEIQRDKINKLNTIVNKQEQELNSLKSTLVQINNIENILKIKQSAFPKAVACRIISRSPSSWQKEVIIDKGSDHGLKPSMVIVTSRGILGQIQEVKKNYSIVQLMTSSQVKFGAIIERSKIMGILFGDKAGYAQLKFIPIGSNVQKGDLVITSEVNPLGLERSFPSSYPVGRVVEVAHYENNAELFIKVKLFEDGLKSRHALVLLPGDTIPQSKIDLNLSFAKDEKQNILPSIKPKPDLSIENNVMSLNANITPAKKEIVSIQPASNKKVLNKPNIVQKEKEKEKETVNIPANNNQTPPSIKAPTAEKTELKPKTEQPIIVNPVPQPTPIKPKEEDDQF